MKYFLLLFVILFCIYSEYSSAYCYKYVYAEYEIIQPYKFEIPSYPTTDEVKIQIQGKNESETHGKYLKYEERKNNNISNTLVIGMALGYEYDKYKYFIMSLRKYYKGDVILFIDENSSEESISFLRNYSIEYINLTKYFPYYSQNNSKYPINSSSILTHIYDGDYYIKYSTLRIYLISMWLNIYGYKYNYYLSCDVRDIYFQSNPFDWNIGKGVYLVEQTYNFKMVNSYYDIVWIIGYKNAYKYLNNTLINGGTIFGSENEITYFYNKMVNLMLKRFVKTTDQSLFNLMLYLYDFTFLPLYVSVNGFGIAWTLHLEVFFNLELYAQPKNNYIYNIDGTIPPIIHSYKDKSLDIIKYHCN